MSFTGASTLQATQITALDNRTTHLESRATTIEQTASIQRSDFQGFVNVKNVKDAEQDTRLSVLEQFRSSSSSEFTDFSATQGAKDAAQDSRMTGIDATVAAHYSEFQSTVQSLNATDSVINTHLSTIDGNIATTNATAAAFRQTYDAYSAANDAKNVEQDTRLTAAETTAAALRAEYNVSTANVAADLSAFHGAYDAYTQANDALNSNQDSRLLVVETKAESTKQAHEAHVALTAANTDSLQQLISYNKNTYDGYVADNDAKNLEQDQRLDAAETRLEAIDTNIIGRVDDAINSKVATVTFDQLADELRNADSALTTALATKVAATVQVATDAAQDAKIDARVLQTTYDTYTAADIKTNNLNEIKIAAMEQFIRTFLSTYTIKNAQDQVYTYKGYAQRAFETAPNAVSIVSKFMNNQNVNLQILEFATRSNSNQVRITSNGGTVSLLSYIIPTSTLSLSTSMGDLVTNVSLIRPVVEADFPLSVRYRDSLNNTISEQVVTFAAWNALQTVDAPATPPPSSDGSIIIGDFTISIHSVIENSWGPGYLIEFSIDSNTNTQYNNLQLSFGYNNSSFIVTTNTFSVAPWRRGLTIMSLFGPLTDGNILTHIRVVQDGSNNAITPVVNVPSGVFKILTPRPFTVSNINLNTSSFDLTSTKSFVENSIYICNIINGSVVDNLPLSGGAVPIGTVTRTSGVLNNDNVGKTYQLYALPSNKMSWEMQFLYPVSEPFTLVASPPPSTSMPITVSNINLSSAPEFKLNSTQYFAPNYVFAAEIVNGTPIGRSNINGDVPIGESTRATGSINSDNVGKTYQLYAIPSNKNWWEFEFKYAVSEPFTL